MIKKHKMILASIVLMVMLLSTARGVTLAQDQSKAALVTYYRDARAWVYDKFRGIYGRDYSFNWDTNKYTFFKNYTTIPVPIPADIYSPNTVIVDGKLDEKLWTDIQPVVVSLEPTFPWGGAIKKVSVRAINNGTWVFMAFQWEDTTESRDESARIKRPEGGFFYNKTHFYSDNLFIGWWMNSERPTVKPWFNAHFAGTTLGQVPWKDYPSAKAGLWAFKAYWVDDDSRYWPQDYYEALGKFTWGPHAGEPLFKPYPHLTETFLNSTANYFIGSGVIHVSGCAFPERDTYPYDLRGNGLWREGVWTLEVARPFKPHPLNEPLGVTMRLEADKVYWVFFGAADGHHGENEDVGSISQWLTLYVEPAPLSSFTTTPWFFITIGVIAAVATVGALALRRRGVRR